MVVRRPHQGSSTQALRIEIKRCHRRVYLFGVGWPSGLGENLLQYAAAEPTFGAVGRREGVFAVGRRLADLLLRREIVLEQSVGGENLEAAVADAVEFILSLD